MKKIMLNLNLNRKCCVQTKCTGRSCFLFLIIIISLAIGGVWIGGREVENGMKETFLFWRHINHCHQPPIARRFWTNDKLTSYFQAALNSNVRCHSFFRHYILAAACSYIMYNAFCVAHSNELAEMPVTHAHTQQPRSLSQWATFIAISISFSFFLFTF